MNQDPSKSPPRLLTQSRALYCFVVNQLATPGLGSVMGKRMTSGALQLVLSVTGFFLILTWMFEYFYRVASQQTDGASAPRVNNALGKWGLILFGASWLWSLATSISLLREAAAQETAKAAVPPRITNPPSQM